MKFQLHARHLVVVAALLSAGCGASSMTAAAVVLPDPAVDEPLAVSKGQPAAVFAGGCFWGVDAVFKHVRGVTRVTSGYAGGSASTAVYDIVGTGRTGHAESVEIVYDSSQISYGQLLKIFFAIAHDPTELNRQGPDEGSEYRSVIFFASDEQRRIGSAYIDQLNAAGSFPRPIVTEVAALKGFYQAEPYHQDYVARHPDMPYIRIYDLPKVENLRIQFPDVYVSR
jgi:peptide-methionine (S)-S-oxide reductase